MRAPMGHRDRNQTVQMTPMIDVVFQLLIFFICTASFAKLEELLPTHMLAPGTAQSSLEQPPTQEHEPILVRIGLAEGRPTWEIAGRQLGSLAEVRGVLGTLGGVAALRQNLPVRLMVAGDVPLGDVIDVYDLCLGIGFEKIQFAANVKK
jgi:biopolymer transport protein ExbD